MATTKGRHDLLVVLDATASMSSSIAALNKSLPEIISLSALTGCFERIGVVAYRDYCDRDIIEWSGWCAPGGAATASTADNDNVNDPIVSQEAVLEMAGKIRAAGGGDWPEAAKTGLAAAYDKMRPEATTVMLFYTDAPPHFGISDESGHQKMEKLALEKKRDNKYGRNAALFVDWVSAAKALRAGPKRAVVFSVVTVNSTAALTPYLYLSSMTGGASFVIDRLTADLVSRLTLGVLLTWMGAGKAVERDDTHAGTLRSYMTSVADDITKVKSETDSESKKFFSRSSQPRDFQGFGNLSTRDLLISQLPKVLRARGPSVRNFAARYAEDPAYKTLAVDQLRRIIAANVAAVSMNPIFGTLWRTVCADRANPARDELITAFGREVDALPDGEERDRMKAWLEESYNYAEEIQEMIASVKPEDRFPLVYLDPTAVLDGGAGAGAAGDEDEDGHDENVGKLTRAELLEIGRSCDYCILRRLGRVLTRLSYVAKAEDLPAHIRTADPAQVPRMPMALAGDAHKRQFWKVLLHCVVPGTHLGARPAALLAALALRMGIVPLRAAADRELMAYRGAWNTIEIPETWNVGCLGLLLDADRDYEGRVADGVTQPAESDDNNNKESEDAVGILKAGDRALFQTLVDYKMLEMNLDTALAARVGWTPDKTKSALGPLIVCRRCRLPRSVTIMASGDLCGVCASHDPAKGDRACACGACSPAENDPDGLATRANVSAGDTAETPGHWVECTRAACRAQYVVYNPGQLRVRAKCFYCRHAHGAGKPGPAPTVECRQCLSRMIWPAEYRPAGMDAAGFTCPACTSGSAETITTVQASPRSLAAENGRAWLLRNDDGAIAEPFNGRSLFHAASNCHVALSEVANKVQVIPGADDSLALTLRGKLVRNPADVAAALRSWVSARRTEAGTCSLCFTSRAKTRLHSACGRSGCRQLVCDNCTQAWYGLNARGRIISVAALSCAFCRRRPAPRVVQSFGLARLGNLNAAVKDAGSWIYAWCARCGTAKKFVERRCAAGAPPAVQDWRCDDCEVEVEAERVARGELLEDSMNVMVRECPGCGAATQKVGGCDHITCMCGQHWCFGCGEGMDEDKIYPHIGREHGGLWVEEQDADDEDGWVHRWNNHGLHW